MRDDPLPIEIEIDPDSVVRPFDEGDVDRTEQYYGIAFDNEYLATICRINGAIPAKKFFRAEDGNVYAVERFLHFSDLSSLQSADPLIEYNVGVDKTRADDSECFALGLMPFAVVWAEPDRVCFDFRDAPPGKAPVVVWLLGQSDEDDPFTVPVAGSFREFASLLSTAEEAGWEAEE